MMKKLITRMAAIMTVHKLVFFLIAISLLQGCRLFQWEIDYDYHYRTMMANTTNDTLVVVINDSLANGLINYTLYPYDTTDIENGIEVDNGQDVILAVFSDGKRDYYYRVVSIFKNDSLLKKWEGPMSMNDSTHHFFNYNSWKSWLIDASNDGIALFSIYSSDFEN